MWSGGGHAGGISPANEITALSQVQKKKLMNVRYIECVPVNGRKISRLNKKFWLEEDGDYYHKGEIIPKICFHDQSRKSECVDSLEDFEEGMSNVLFTDEEIHYASDPGGILVNSLGTIYMVTKGDGTEIKVGLEPARVFWGDFPLALHGVTISRSDLQEHGSAGSGRFMSHMITTYRAEDYSIVLRDKSREQRQQLEALEKLSLDFVELIKTSPIIQTISGTAIGLMVLITLIVGVLCWKVKACRRYGRNLFCCCCDGAAAARGLRDRLEEERSRLMSMYGRVGPTRPARRRESTSGVVPRQSVVGFSSHEDVRQPIRESSREDVREEDEEGKFL